MVSAQVAVTIECYCRCDAALLLEEVGLVVWRQVHNLPVAWLLWELHSVVLVTGTVANLFRHVADRTAAA